MKKMLSAFLVWLTALLAPAAVQAAPLSSADGPKTHQTPRPGPKANREGPQTRRSRHQVPRRRKRIMLADGHTTKVDQGDRTA